MPKRLQPNAPAKTTATKQSKKFSKAVTSSAGRSSIRITHKGLGEQFAEVGRSMRTLLGKSRKGSAPKKITLKPGTGYTPKRVRLLLQDRAKVNAKTKFGQYYRGIQVEQDELVSTSSVRELMAGLLEGGTLPNAQVEEIEAVFEELSKLRFPTRWTGFALKGEVMQHPTAKGSGLFAESSQTMALHNKLDLDRRAEVAEAVSTARYKKGATPQTIVAAGMLAAIAFTLNEMAAPVTAKDVRPFAQVKGKKQAELDAQVAARDHLKKIFVALGGKQDAGKANLTRAWAPRRGRRSASPARVANPDEMKLSTPRLA